jgi:hypothetical protein
MTTATPSPGTDPAQIAAGTPGTPRSLFELAHKATILASLAEGLDVLHEQADGAPECLLTRRARNAIRPAIEATIAAAWALTLDIEATERAENEKRKAMVGSDR